MKTSVVPAQITTIEDKIAGNMTFPQILLLVISLVLGTIIYTIVPPSSHLSIMKVTAIGVQFLILGLLAVRIKGQTIADRLIMLLRFALRPRLYLFTKNDLSTRDIIQPEKTKKIVKTSKDSIKKKKAVTTKSKADQFLLDRLLKDPSLMVRLELGKKGGIDVSLKTDES